MTYGTVAYSASAVAYFDFDADDVDYDEPRPARRTASRKRNTLQNVVGGAALAWVAAACGWTLYTNVTGPAVDLAAPKSDFAASVTAARSGAEPAARQKVAVASPAAASPSAQPVLAKRDMTLLDVAVLDARHFLGFSPGTFSGVAPKSDRLALSTHLSAPKSDRLALAEPPHVEKPETVPSASVQAVPTPAPRPSILRTLQSRLAADGTQRPRELTTASLERPAQFKNPFAKLFHSSGSELAYAASDDNADDRQVTVAGRTYPFDQWTAVYDISAHLVYLPDGTKLEAHSGYGSRLDDPKHVADRNLGATPPQVYDLEPREDLFHGVRALRLNPLGGEETIFGRSGILAHTYMLGPRGDSNGCVSFKNYEAFLQAYRDQKVKRLLVVAHLS